MSIESRETLNRFSKAEGPKTAYSYALVPPLNEEAAHSKALPGTHGDAAALSTVTFNVLEMSKVGGICNGPPFWPGPRNWRFQCSGDLCGGHPRLRVDVKVGNGGRFDAAGKMMELSRCGGSGACEKDRPGLGGTCGEI